MKVVGNQYILFGKKFNDYISTANDCYTYDEEQTCLKFRKYILEVRY